MRKLHPVIWWYALALLVIVLDQLTKVAALALAKNNIRVNAVGPGSIDTEMMAGVNANPEAFKTAMSRTPLGRPGTARLTSVRL